MSIDPERWLWAALTVGLWLLLTMWTAWRARPRAVAAAQVGETLIAVASQTGFGDELAEMTRRAFAEAGRAAQDSRRE